MSSDKRTEQDIKLQPSNIRDIDAALFSYVEDLKLATKTNEGAKQVPVIWTGAERSFQIKEEKKLRDKNGVLILPQITVERVSMTKDIGDKASYFADTPAVQDYKGGAITWTRKINQDKTSNFENARAMRKYGSINFQTRKDKQTKTIYSIFTVANPVYVRMTYQVVLRTEYQRQMNDLVQPLLTDSRSSNYFLVSNESHRYEAFYQEDYSIENNIANYDEEERVFKTIVNIEVLGYLLGEGKNDPQPYKKIRENAVEASLDEVVITGSIDDYLKNN